MVVRTASKSAVASHEVDRESLDAGLPQNRSSSQIPQITQITDHYPVVGRRVTTTYLLDECGNVDWSCPINTRVDVI
jgi:DNA polymerase II large subunit